MTSKKRNRQKDYFKKYDRTVRHGITEAYYDGLMRGQADACALCRRPFDEKLTPCVDHDHSCCQGSFSCGQCVRGLLCHSCNRDLGAIDRFIREGAVGLVPGTTLQQYLEARS